MACIRFLVETMLNAYANRMNADMCASHSCTRFCWSNVIICHKSRLCMDSLWYSRKSSPNVVFLKFTSSVVKMSKKGFELSDQVLLQISNASYSYDF
ncbi:hypothetical protein T09_3906 [Trichinella sp. T9]|nr:hypothetical protein T09_3906 [Trichinella sp. T9]